MIIRVHASNPHAYAFASDTTAPMTPESLEALGRANDGGCVASYGEDPTTSRAVDAVRAAFACDCEVCFVASGTAANALAVAAVCESHEAVFCHEESHLEKDECGAPGFFRPGLRLHALPGPGAKVDWEHARSILGDNRGVHSSQPRVLSLTQATEFGTVYSLDETAAAARFARQHGLILHMDGARFANAVATLRCSPAEASWKAGVDILSLGGSKNGIGIGEAVVFFNRALAARVAHLRKQAGHLIAKGRFLAAPWVAALEAGRWLQRAAHANSQAQRLAAAFRAAGLGIAFPVEANGVFVHLDNAAVAHLESRGWHFYRFHGDTTYRFLCSWRTQDEEVDALAEDLRNRPRDTRTEKTRDSACTEV